MKILVLGASGMLGHVTYLYLQSRGYEVVGTSNTKKVFKDNITLNVENIQELEEFLDDGEFDVVINCIATLVKESEKNKPKAVFINSYIPHMLEKKYIETNTRVIHVSTDGVFNGNNAPYVESDIADTNTFYGKSKALGEIVNGKDLTIRGSFIGPDISSNGTGLFNWFMHQKGEVNGYSKVRLNAVTSLEFVKFIEGCLKSTVHGIYHLGAKYSYSKYDLLCELDRLFNMNIKINPVDKYISDNTINSTLVSDKYVRKDINNMLYEMKKWMVDNKVLYFHYRENLP